MSNKTIKVRAAEGLRVFFPHAVAAAPGRRTKILEGEETLEVSSNMRFVRRSIRCGDLVVVQPEGEAEAAPEADEPEAEFEVDLENEENSE